MDNNINKISSQRIKRCWKCGEFKEIIDFGKNKGTYDGIRSLCKECDKKQAKEYREKNKEKVKEKARQNYHENADFYKQKFREYGQKNAKKIKKRRKKHYEENKERIIQEVKNYYEINKEKVKQYQKMYREKHSNEIRANFREYYKNNKEKLRKTYLKWYNSDRGREKIFQYNLKRRSQKFHVRFEGIRRKELLDRDNWKCRNCGCKVHDRSAGGNENRHLWDDEFKAHIDHIIPISKGGHSEPSNLQVLCRTCNLSKQDKINIQLDLFESLGV